MTAMNSSVDRVVIGFVEVPNIDVLTKCRHDELNNVATMPTIDSTDVPALVPDLVQLI